MDAKAAATYFLTIPKDGDHSVMLEAAELFHKLLGKPSDMWFVLQSLNQERHKWATAFDLLMHRLHDRMVTDGAGPKNDLALSAIITSECLGGACKFSDLFGDNFELFGYHPKESTYEELDAELKIAEGELIISQDKYLAAVEKFCCAYKV